MNGSDYCSILVKTREGRPIKIEGNPKSGVTMGGTSARAQASVVSLYDSARLRYPKTGGKKTTWATIDREIATKLAAANGPIVLLTRSIYSPSTLQAIEDFKGRFPGTRHLVYEPISTAGISLANERDFGQRVVPSYRFDRADVIVSFGADFLGTWISPIEFARQYISRRKVRKDNPAMSKHWQFECKMTITGANADKRFSVLPSQEGVAMVALYNEIARMRGGGGAGAATLKDANLQKAITQAAMELNAAAGRSLVVCGSNDTNLQTVANAINGLLGNYGATLDLSRPYNTHQADDAAVAQLVTDMNARRVGAVILCHVNPGYSYPQADQFLAGLKNVPLTISFNDREDETAASVQYLCPDNHFLELWNDAEPKEGFFSLSQPTISRLFDTRQMQESLLTWAGNTSNFYDYVKNYWQQNIFPRAGFGNFQTFWDAALHDGIFETDNPEKTVGTFLMRGELVPTTATSDTSKRTLDTYLPDGEQVAQTFEGSTATVSGVGTAAAAIVQNASRAGDLELVAYETVMMGDGCYANNPFLQETPDPISKVCWDNFVSVSPKYAEEKGWEEYDIIEVKMGNYAVQLPLIWQPGQPYGSCSIALGYGRTKPGSEHSMVGKNAFPFVTFNAQTQTFNYVALTGVTLNKVGSEYGMARTQTHSTIDDDRFIIGASTLENYKKDPYAGNHYTVHQNELKKEGEFNTLYGPDPVNGSHTDLYKRAHHWGMSIDFSSCIGCGACVTACSIENNVPIVGQNEVRRAHEMHWMRIDRYYSGDDLENPDVSFMPMLCQHCDHAPCENVCPVNATNHSGEGLNQMAYNRCIGTRYCANNCPYKVRRFNWFDYQGADSFYGGTIFDNDEYIMVDDLTRMVLNPDVTVRSRGVMEKCSFCVQRIQESKLLAKRENRELVDGDVVVACQQACPTEAIIFGNVNDSKSAVSLLNATERTYYLLEEIHVLPAIGYMTKLRNREPEVGHEQSHTHDGEHPTNESHEQKQVGAPDGQPQGGEEGQHEGGHGAGH